MNLEEPDRMTPESDPLESLLRSYAPAPAKASVAETFYRAGQATAGRDLTLSRPAMHWAYFFLSGAGSGVAACLVGLLVWSSNQSMSPHPSMAQRSPSPPAAQPSSDTEGAPSTTPDGRGQVADVDSSTQDPSIPPQSLPWLIEWAMQQRDTDASVATSRPTEATSMRESFSFATLSPWHRTRMVSSIPFISHPLQSPHHREASVHAKSIDSDQPRAKNVRTDVKSLLHSWQGGEWEL